MDEDDRRMWVDGIPSVRPRRTPSRPMFKLVDDEVSPAWWSWRARQRHCEQCWLERGWAVRPSDCPHDPGGGVA